MIKETEIPELADVSSCGDGNGDGHGDAQNVCRLKKLTSRPSLPGLIVQQFLGRGGFGQVWKAKHDEFQPINQQSEQEMALKVIFKGNYRTLKTEVELWRMLSNKAFASACCAHDIPIVKMYGIHLTESGCPAISMQLCKGGSLAQHLENLAAESVSGKQVFLEESDAAMVASRIANALGFCHENRVLHLDVKPDNVLIDMSDSNSDCGTMHNRISSCFLAVFGLSRMLPHMESSACQEFGEGPYMMESGYICGTVGYMAPEVITDGLYSPAADAWSLGALLLEALTGRLPPHCEEDPSDLIWEFEDWKSGFVTFIV